ncbi:MAG: hypothetical protein QCI82_04045 [Candidatus Thermoplasmatota archaeon]|nr:hypothetical protein [Candidatus Thermoplasmatota archaeon]
MSIGRSPQFKDEEVARTTKKSVKLPLDLFRRILSGVLITLCLVLTLIGLSEIIVFLLDRINGVDNYVSWEKSFIIPWVLSAFTLAIFFLLNIKRFLGSRYERGSKPSTGRIEIPELD